MNSLKLLSCTLVALTAFLNAPSASARDFTSRVELMKYAIEEEAKHPVDLHTTSKSQSFFKTFLESVQPVLPAEAYREGDACLVLGFQSTFEDGVCRFSAAQGVKNYRNDCAATELPCNPQVFGKSDDNHAFCVSTQAKQLSRSCAYEAFSSVNQKSPIPGFAGTTAETFNLKNINFAKVDAKLQEEFSHLFKSPDASLDSAVSFTQNLCSSIKRGRRSGQQPADLKNCRSYLGMLSKMKEPSEEKPIAVPAVAKVVAAKAPVAKSLEAKVDAPKATVAKAETVKQELAAAVIGKPSVSAARDTLSSIPVVAITLPIEKKKPEADPAPVDTVKTKAKSCPVCAVPDTARPIQASTSDQMMSTVRALASSSADQISVTEWSNKFLSCEKALTKLSGNSDDRYWLKVDGTKTFGLRCYNQDNESAVNKDDNKTKTFALFTENGVQFVQFPTIRYSRTGGQASFEHGDPTVPYKYISAQLNGKQIYLGDDIGDFMHIYGSTELTAKQKQTYIDKYTEELSKKNMKVDSTFRAPTGAQVGFAKSCARSRASNQLSNVFFETYNDEILDYDRILPDFSKSGKELAPRYSRSVDQIKSDIMNSVFKKAPSCIGILDSKSVDAAFKTAYGNRIDNYNRLHAIAPK